MAWVIDTCVVLDVAIADHEHGKKSAQLLESKLKDGLIICPVTFVELVPQFEGKSDLLEEFCGVCGINFDESWTRADTEEAGAAFHRYIELKRAGKSVRRPIADILIGAFASRFRGIITRNPQDFTSYFKKLRILTP